MDINKKTYENVAKLDEIIKELGKQRDQLLEIKDINGKVIKRAELAKQDLGHLLHSLEMIRHDLRDDYGNNYQIMQGKE